MFHGPRGCGTCLLKLHEFVHVYQKLHESGDELSLVQTAARMFIHAVSVARL